MPKRYGEGHARTPRARPAATFLAGSGRRTFLNRRVDSQLDSTKAGDVPHFETACPGVL
jgi:hypothetical protein